MQLRFIDIRQALLHDGCRHPLSNSASVQPHRIPYVHGNLIALSSHRVRIHQGSVFSHVSLTSRRHTQVGQQQLRASTTTSRFRAQSQQRFSASPSGLAVTATRTAARATKRVKRMVVSRGGEVVRAAPTDGHAYLQRPFIPRHARPSGSPLISCAAPYWIGIIADARIWATPLLTCSRRMCPDDAVDS
jgi:hypothetical protein